MKLLHSKVFQQPIVLVSLCPNMNLLAVVTEGQLLIYRSTSMTAVWCFPLQEEREKEDEEEKKVFPSSSPLSSSASRVSRRDAAACACCWSPSGRLFVVSLPSGVIHLYDVEGGQLLRCFHPMGHAKHGTSKSASPDRTWNTRETEKEECHKEGEKQGHFHTLPEEGEEDDETEEEWEEDDDEEEDDHHGNMEAPERFLEGAALPALPRYLRARLYPSACHPISLSTTPQTPVLALHWGRTSAPTSPFFYDSLSSLTSSSFSTLGTPVSTPGGWGGVFGASSSPSPPYQDMRFATGSSASGDPSSVWSSMHVAGEGRRTSSHVLPLASRVLPLTVDRLPLSVWLGELFSTAGTTSDGTPTMSTAEWMECDGFPFTFTSTADVEDDSVREVPLHTQTRGTATLDDPPVPPSTDGVSKSLVPSRKRTTMISMLFVLDVEGVLSVIVGGLLEVFHCRFSFPILSAPVGRMDEEGVATGSEKKETRHDGLERREILPSSREDNASATEPSSCSGRKARLEGLRVHQVALQSVLPATVLRGSGSRYTTPTEMDSSESRRRGRRTSVWTDGSHPSVGSSGALPLHRPNLFLDTDAFLTALHASSCNTAAKPWEARLREAQATDSGSFPLTGREEDKEGEGSSKRGTEAGFTSLSSWPYRGMSSTTGEELAFPWRSRLSHPHHSLFLVVEPLSPLFPAQPTTSTPTIASSSVGSQAEFLLELPLYDVLSTLLSPNVVAWCVLQEYYRIAKIIYTTTLQRYRYAYRHLLSLFGLPEAAGLLKEYLCGILEGSRRSDRDRKHAGEGPGEPSSSSSLISSIVASSFSTTVSYASFFRDQEGFDRSVTRSPNAIASRTSMSDRTSARMMRNKSKPIREEEETPETQENEEEEDATSSQEESHRGSGVYRHRTPSSMAELSVCSPPSPEEKVRALSNYFERLLSLGSAGYTEEEKKKQDKKQKEKGLTNVKEAADGTQGRQETKKGSEKREHSEEKKKTGIERIAFSESRLRYATHQLLQWVPLLCYRCYDILLGLTEEYPQDVQDDGVLHLSLSTQSLHRPSAALGSSVSSPSLILLFGALRRQAVLLVRHVQEEFSLLTEFLQWLVSVATSESTLGMIVAQQQQWKREQFRAARHGVPTKETGFESWMKIAMRMILADSKVGPPSAAFLCRRMGKERKRRREVQGSRHSFSHTMRHSSTTSTDLHHPRSLPASRESSSGTRRGTSVSLSQRTPSMEKEGSLKRTEKEDFSTSVSRAEVETEEVLPMEIRENEEDEDTEGEEDDALEEELEILKREWAAGVEWFANEVSQPYHGPRTNPPPLPSSTVPSFPPLPSYPFHHHHHHFHHHHHHLHHHHHFHHHSLPSGPPPPFTPSPPSPAPAPSTSTVQNSFIMAPQAAPPARTRITHLVDIEEGEDLRRGEGESVLSRVIPSSRSPAVGAPFIPAPSPPPRPPVNNPFPMSSSMKTLTQGQRQYAQPIPAHRLPVVYRWLWKAEKAAQLMAKALGWEHHVQTGSEDEEGTGTTITFHDGKHHAKQQEEEKRRRPSSKETYTEEEREGQDCMANCTEKHLSYPLQFSFLSVSDVSFQLSYPFFMKTLSKWIPELSMMDRHGLTRGVASFPLPTKFEEACRGVSTLPWGISWEVDTLRLLTTDPGCRASAFDISPVLQYCPVAKRHSRCCHTRGRGGPPQPYTAGTGVFSFSSSDDGWEERHDIKAADGMKTTTTATGSSPLVRPHQEERVEEERRDGRSGDTHASEKCASPLHPTELEREGRPDRASPHLPHGSFSSWLSSPPFPATTTNTAVGSHTSSLRSTPPPPPISSGGAAHPSLPSVPTGGAPPSAFSSLPPPHSPVSSTSSKANSSSTPSFALKSFLDTVFDDPGMRLLLDPISLMTSDTIVSSSGTGTSLPPFPHPPSGPPPPLASSSTTTGLPSLSSLLPPRAPRSLSAEVDFQLYRANKRAIKYIQQHFATHHVGAAQELEEEDGAVVLWMRRIVYSVPSEPFFPHAACRGSSSFSPSPYYSELSSPVAPRIGSSATGWWDWIASPQDVRQWWYEAHATSSASFIPHEEDSLREEEAPYTAATTRRGERRKEISSFLFRCITWEEMAQRPVLTLRVLELLSPSSSSCCHPCKGTTIPLSTRTRMEVEACEAAMLSTPAVRVLRPCVLAPSFEHLSLSNSTFRIDDTVLTSASGVLYAHATFSHKGEATSGGIGYEKGWKEEPSSSLSPPLELPHRMCAASSPTREVPGANVAATTHGREDREPIRGKGYDEPAPRFRGFQHLLNNQILLVFTSCIPAISSSSGSQPANSTSTLFTLAIIDGQGQLVQVDSAEREEEEEHTHAPKDEEEGTGRRGEVQVMPSYGLSLSGVNGQRPPRTEEDFTEEEDAPPSMNENLSEEEAQIGKEEETARGRLCGNPSPNSSSRRRSMNHDAGNAPAILPLLVNESFASSQPLLMSVSKVKEVAAFASGNRLLVVDLYEG